MVLYKVLQQTSLHIRFKHDTPLPPPEEPWKVIQRETEFTRDSILPHRTSPFLMVPAEDYRRYSVGGIPGYAGCGWWLWYGVPKCTDDKLLKDLAQPGRAQGCSAQQEEGLKQWRCVTHTCMRTCTETHTPNTHLSTGKSGWRAMTNVSF